MSNFDYYRGLTLTLTPGDSRTVRLLQALAGGATSAARDRLMEMLQSGTGTNGWTGEPVGQNSGVGSWWTTDKSAAWTYAITQPDWGVDALTFEVVLTADLQGDRSLDHEDGNGAQWPVLESGDPITVGEVEAELPTREQAKRLLRLISEQGAWQDVNGMHDIDTWEDPWIDREIKTQRYSWRMNMRTEAKGKDTSVPFSEHGDERFKDAGVSVKKTPSGQYYVCTHRARSKYHDKVSDITDSEIKRIESTGSKTAKTHTIVGGDFDGISFDYDYVYKGSRNGEMYFITLESAGVTARTETGSQAGFLNVAVTVNEISSVSVQRAHQRQGLATEMLKEARKMFPGLTHTTVPGQLSPNGEAWAKVVGSVGPMDAARYEVPFPGIDWKVPGEKYWHGTPDGDLRGGTFGLHLGTKEAARQALEARIGKRADGRDWDGSTRYGETLLMGKDSIRRAGDYLTGYNSSAPKEDHYPTGEATYGAREAKVPMSARPTLAEFSVLKPVADEIFSDEEVHDKIRESIRSMKSGGTGVGYLYENEGEDVGSISIVVPDESWVRPTGRVARKASKTANNIPALPEWAIEQQFSQYPASAPEGVSYFKGEINEHMWVDCLLYAKGGKVVAVLNRFPKDMGPEKKNNVLLIVRPEYRRQGIGTALWREAQKRWGVKAQGQDQTPNGKAFTDRVGALTSALAGSAADPTTLWPKTASTKIDVSVIYKNRKGQRRSTYKANDVDHARNMAKKIIRENAGEVLHISVWLEPNLVAIWSAGKGWEPPREPDRLGLKRLAPEEYAKEFERVNGFPFRTSAKQVTHAGIAIQAEDTGRVLMLQRSFDPTDDPDVQGTWEFPGGSIDEGESPEEAAWREFHEETGLPRPDCTFEGSWTSRGIYEGHLFRVKKERKAFVEINPDIDACHVENPDDREKENPDVTAWMSVQHIKDLGKALRPAVRTGTDWDLFKISGIRTTSAIGPWVRMEEGRPTMEYISMENDMHSWKCPKCGDEGRPTWDQGNNLESAQAHAEFCQNAAHYREVDLITPPIKEYNHKEEWARRHPHLVDQLGRAYVGARSGTFWRVHPEGRAFGDWDATSKPFFVDEPRKPGQHPLEESPSREWRDGDPVSHGYSCFENPWHLYLYVSIQWSNIRDSTTVLRFPGERVGEGHDGEDLAIPSALPFKTTWGALQEMLPDLPVPESPIFAPWVRQRREMASWETLAKHWGWLDMENPVHEFIIEKFGGRK